MQRGGEEVLSSKYFIDPLECFIAMTTDRDAVGATTMHQVKQFFIGVRPDGRVLRLASDWGSVADALLRARGKVLPEGYYDRWGRNERAYQTNLTNEDRGNELRLSPSDVVFVKSAYGTDGYVDVDAAFREFETVYKIVEEVIRPKSVRRIGIVTEERIGTDDPSKVLMQSITKFQLSGYPAKFMFAVERRLTTMERQALDVAKDDFVNVICQLYDSQRDQDDPVVDASVNVNVDVQRYYKPPYTNDVITEVKRHRKVFERERRALWKSLSALGLNQSESKSE